MSSRSADDAALRAGLDDLLRHGDPPIVIVTAHDETARDEKGARAGCLVGFTSQCGIEPVRYAVWLSVRNHTYEIARRSTHLAAHVLTKRQQPLAEFFGSVSGHTRDKFEECEWDDGPYGLPILRAAAGWFAGPARHVPSSGDHELFIISPHVAHGRLDAPPLAFQDVKGVNAGNPA